eukprot:4437025-Pleurochrysis_carterae.AAC.1
MRQRQSPYAKGLRGWQMHQDEEKTSKALAPDRCVHVSWCTHAVTFQAFRIGVARHQVFSCTSRTPHSQEAKISSLRLPALAHARLQLMLAEGRRHSLSSTAAHARRLRLA